MEVKCKNHPERKSFNICHKCGKYYCKECLNEGKEYYYCNEPSCYEKFKEEIENIPKKEIKTYASFSYRFAAYVIDGIILFIANSIIFIPLYFAGAQINPDDVIMEFDWFIVFRHPLFYFTGLLYFSIMESSQKMGTFGKRMQGIIVVTRKGKKISFGRALARNFCRLFTTISIVGYLLPLFLKKKQTLHDLICYTLVLNAEALPLKLNDKVFTCDKCKNELELNLDELIKKEFLCPECNSINKISL